MCYFDFYSIDFRQYSKLRKRNKLSLRASIQLQLASLGNARSSISFFLGKLLLASELLCIHPRSAHKKKDSEV